MSILTHVCLNTIYKYRNSTTKNILRNTYKFFNRYPIEELLLKDLISNSKGDIEIIKWAHMNGYIMKDIACEYVAKYGYLNILKWLHENGCPWDKSTCIYAADSGYLDCLKYAHENGCQWNRNKCLSTAKTYNHIHIIKWIEQN